MYHGVQLCAVPSCPKRVFSSVCWGTMRRRKLKQWGKTETEDVIFMPFSQCCKLSFGETFYTRVRKNTANVILTLLVTQLGTVLKIK